MRDKLLRALRFFILGAAVGGVSAFTVLHADDGAPAQSPTPVATKNATPPPAEPPDTKAPGKTADKPAPAAPKVFVPTDEISPDQEIDFPADL